MGQNHITLCSFFFFYLFLPVFSFYHHSQASRLASLTDSSLCGCRFKELPPAFVVTKKKKSDIVADVRYSVQNGDVPTCQLDAEAVGPYWSDLVGWSSRG